MDNLRRKVVHQQNGFGRQSKLLWRGFVALSGVIVIILLASVLLLSLTAGAPVGALTTMLAPSPASSQTPTPQISATVALNTPAPVPLPAPSNRLMLILGALLCIVAPFMLLLGGLIFLAGLGVFDRARRQREVLQRIGAAGAPVSASSPRFEEKPSVVTRSASKPSAPTKPASVTIADKATSSGAAAVCPNCSHANRSQARYCAACGAPLQAVQSTQERPSFCWNCGYRLRPTSRYCPRCGDKI